MIDVTGVNKVELVKKAYDLSRPQGMGMLHFQPGSLSDEEAQSFIKSDGTVSLDYIKGRACKFNVLLRNSKFFIHSPWFDHTDQQLTELLAHVGIDYKEEEEHGIVCNCDPCREKHGKQVLNPNTGS